MTKPAAGFAPPSPAWLPGGNARKSVTHGAAKPQPVPDFRVDYVNPLKRANTCVLALFSGTA